MQKDQQRRINNPVVEYTQLSDQEKLDRAFSILFDEVAKDMQAINGPALSTHEMAIMNN